MKAGNGRVVQNRGVQNLGEAAAFMEQWLRQQVRDAGGRGIVVGLSGGIDSAVVAALAQRAFGDVMMTLVLPCHSNPQDALDAALVAQHFGFPCQTIDLSPVFDALVAGMTMSLSEMAKANVKARLRMTTLYGVAQSLSLLVCGTSNKAEREVGYFTKFGDSASDLLPLAGLLKGEVRALARWLGVPEPVITKAPTAGLWAGQTDEAEMGFNYDVLDCYLKTGEATVEVREKIEAMRSKSEHKRLPVPICALPDGLFAV